MPKSLAIALTGLLAGACAIRPNPVSTCALPIIPIETALPDGHPFKTTNDVAAGCDTPSAAVTFQGLLTEVLCDPPAKRLGQSESDPARILILSGGSHNGSYGAGYLEGWADGQRLPPFKLVTGISTGAVLATSAFLGDGQKAAEKFRLITHERQLLNTYARMKKGKIVATSYPAILRNGAVADLAPLKKWLLDYLTSSVINQVADRYIDDEARLLVGAVDAESGKAVAINLTEIALRHKNAKSDVDKLNLRSCYADAIVASSSAPLAAKPVFIDNRAYVDGGVRFGVFHAAIAESLQSIGNSWRVQNEKRAEARLAFKPAPHLYILFNGTQMVDPWCGDKMTDAHCAERKDPKMAVTQVRKSWDLLGLGLRTVDLMANQLARFSVSDIEQKYRLAFEDTSGFFYTRILPGHLDFDYAAEDKTMSCAKWYKYDEDKLRPVQFHPHYMKCLIAAGHVQAVADGRTGERPR